MALKFFIIFIVFIALLAGCLTAISVVMPHNMMILHILIIKNFFEVTLPILAFGALIKYLCK